MKKELTPEEKEEKKKKRQLKKEEDEKKETLYVDSKDQTFVNRYGTEIPLLDFIHEDEVWIKETKRVEDKKILIFKKRIITYEGIKRMAAEAGVFYFNKTPIFAPSIENSKLNSFDVTVYCRAGKEEIPDVKGSAECLHGFFKTTMLGEADMFNTRSVAGAYKGLTAERRGYVRAVINHLGLKNVYGEEELDEGGELPSEDLPPTRAEFEALRELLNQILNAEDVDQLKVIGGSISESKGDYSEAQLKYLRRVWEQKKSSFGEKPKF